MFVVIICFGSCVCCLGFDGHLIRFASWVVVFLSVFCVCYLMLFCVLFCHYLVRSMLCCFCFGVSCVYGCFLVFDYFCCVCFLVLFEVVLCVLVFINVRPCVCGMCFVRNVFMFACWAVVFLSVDVAYMCLYLCWAIVCCVCVACYVFMFASWVFVLLSVKCVLSLFLLLF